MSEYQYYEFRAVDRPLGGREMAALRRVSSRAEITPTSFVNTYDFGDFRGDPDRWMAKYFDAFVYVANWGSRELMLRVPRPCLDPRLARRYLCGDSASVRAKQAFAVLRFRSDSESDEEFDDGSRWLDRLLPLREEIAGGDLRALYLGWLFCVEQGELDEYAPEPSVPPGLSRLRGGLGVLADFLRIDPGLIRVAARRAPKEDPRGERARLDQFVARLSKDERAAWLRRLAPEEAHQARLELRRKMRAASETPRPRASLPPARTVGELLAAAERRRGST